MNYFHSTVSMSLLAGLCISVSCLITFGKSTEDVYGDVRFPFLVTVIGILHASVKFIILFHKKWNVIRNPNYFKAVISDNLAERVYSSGEKRVWDTNANGCRVDTVHPSDCFACRCICDGLENMFVHIKESPWQTRIHICSATDTEGRNADQKRTSSQN